MSIAVSEEIDGFIITDSVSIERCSEACEGSADVTGCAAADYGGGDACESECCERDVVAFLPYWVVWCTAPVGNDNFKMGVIRKILSPLLSLGEIRTVLWSLFPIR